MRHRSLVIGIIVGTFLFSQAWSVTGAGSDYRSVLLKVHVPFTGG